MASLFIYLDDCNDGEAVPLVKHGCFYGDSLKLLQMACHDVGPAAQTLGALLIHAKESRGHSTFASVGTIAETACLTRRTVIRHLATLADYCWIENLGRQRLPNSRMKRRTCTIVLAAKAVIDQKFFPMPKWLAACSLRWSEKLMLAYLASQQCIKNTNEDEGVGCLDGRESMKRTEICDHTGLTRNTYWNARGSLLKLGAVHYGDGIDTDYDVTRLRLNPDMGVRASAIPSPPQSKLEPSMGQARAKHEPCTGHEQAKHGAPVKPVTGASPNLSQDLPKSVTATSPKVSQKVPKSVTGGAQKCHSHIVEEPIVGTFYKEPSTGTSCKNLLSEHASGAGACSPDPDIGFLFVDPEKDEYQTKRICQAIGVTAGECKFIWTLAAWRRYCVLSEAELESAISGVKTNAEASPIGFLRTHITNQLGAERMEQLKRATKIKKGFAYNVPATKPYVSEAAWFAKTPVSESLPDERQHVEPKETPEQRRESFRKLAAAEKLA